MRRLAPALVVLAPLALRAACPPPSATPGPTVEPLPPIDAGVTRPAPPPPAPTGNAPPPVAIECAGRKLDLARSCTTDADCGVFEARVCCGHVPAYGVRAADARRADTACGPRDCSAMGCPFGGMTMDDGTTGVAPTTIVARCVAGACATRASKSACCEDGSTWRGCCSSRSVPHPHQCGDPAPCDAPCVAQRPCD